MQIVASFFQPLVFDAGCWVLRLPTEVPPHMTAAAEPGPGPPLLPFEVLTACVQVNAGAAERSAEGARAGVNPQLAAVVRP